MKHSVQKLITLMTAFIVTAVVSSSAHADSDSQSSITTITLRSTVRLASDNEQILLGDLAKIDGHQSDELSTLIIPTDFQLVTDQWFSIKRDTVTELIDSDPSIHSGSIVVIGDDIAIFQRADRINQPSQSVVESQTPETPRTDQLRAYIERWAYTRPWLNADPSSVRITFHDSQRDRELLDSPITNRRIILRELGRSSKISCQITIYEEERLVVDTTIRFELEIRRDVRVTNAQIRRGELIDQDRTVIESRWVSPMDSIASPESSIGQACKKTIDPGSVLLSSMLEQPIVVKKGKIVSAQSLSGSVSVTMSVRALASGAIGDLIELESRDRKQRFTARVAGPGRVVIIHDPKPVGTSS
jgi:flagella basal body P-ring formation protein FlgA